MAKKVIQMYDKYKSTTKIYPKVIKECFQDDAQEYIEGQVVANPTLAGTEASLTSLEVGGTKYKVEQPINVVANPTLAGTEADLEGLQVGDTKYKVPSGGGKQLYQHNVFYKYTGFALFTITIINDNNTPFTFTTLRDYINSKDLTFGSNKFINASGSVKDSNNIYNILGVCKASDDSDFRICYAVIDTGQVNSISVSASTTVTDSVITL